MQVNPLEVSPSKGPLVAMHRSFLTLYLLSLSPSLHVQMPVPIIAELIPLLPLLRTVAKVLDHDPLATDLLNAKISTIPYFDNVKIVETFFNSWDSSYALRIDDQQGMTYVRGGWDHHHKHNTWQA